jgi:ubiquinol-cytochrome c reductase cytochrome b subunit
VNPCLAESIIAGAAAAFFAPVFSLGLLIAFVVVHLLLVLKLGINEWPMPGRVVRRATYVEEYPTDARTDGVRFVPAAVWEDVFFSGAVLPPSPRVPRPQSPSVRRCAGEHRRSAAPDCFFLWLYRAVAAYARRSRAPLLVGPAIARVRSGCRSCPARARRLAPAPDRDC